jgi:Ca-activated chloride channel homolog
MNGPIKFTLSAFSLALFFEACTIKKADVGSQDKEESTLAMQQEEQEVVLPNTLQDRLYPNQPNEPQVSPIPKTAVPMLTNPSVGAQYTSPSAPTTSYSHSREKGRRLSGDQGIRYSEEMSPSKRSMDKMARAESDDVEGAERLGCFPNSPYSQPPKQNSEEYASIYENSFMNARTSPLSTFSIDVDGASYSNTRRFLQEGQLPPSDAVRIEEFINYFSYDYPQPTGSDPFSIVTEVATTPWNPETKLVHIGLQGRRSAAENLPPINLVFLIDVSGSMAADDKLPLLKNGFDMLIDQMRPQDQISIVVYAGAAGMVLPPTSGADKEVIREALSRLDAGGSTAGGAGLMLAYQAAKQSFIKGGNNRVILATDGDFNVGISNDDELVRLIEEKRKSGVYLSVLGFGTGNIKDAKMEQLADKGNGNYFYIDNINEARKVLVEKMAGTLFAIAKDVKLQIEFNPALVKSYRLVGYENRVLAAEDFNDDKKDAGELGSGTNVTALYEIVPVRDPRPKVDPLKYQNGGSRTRWNWGFGGNEVGGELLTVKFRYKQPTGTTSKLLSRTLKDKNVVWQDASQNFRFSAAVAGFGLVLRNSQYRGNMDLDKVALIGRGAQGRDLDGHRAEFLNLVETAKSLGGYSRVDSQHNLE